MTKDNIKLAIKDFEWVIKILESSEDENHMETTSKYSDSGLTRLESDVLDKLKLNFWSLYKDKNSKIGTINI